MKTLGLFLLFLTVSARATAPTQQNYFPENAFGEGSQHWSTLYFSQLRILKEPSLYALSKTTKKQSYRFLWMRSFHELVSVRFDLQSDGKAIITVKKGTGPAGASSTQLARSYRRILTQEQSRWFLDQVRESDFWNLVGHHDPDDDGGPDGARWVIEGTKDGKYHVVDRWSPESGPVRILGLKLAIDLAQMKMSAQQIY